jgi:hypothetical protein
MKISVFEYHDSSYQGQPASLKGEELTTIFAKMTTKSIA